MINKVGASAIAAGVVIWTMVAERSFNHKNKSLEIYQDANSRKYINSEVS